MHYKLLGKSGLRVSEICLGTMTFGQDWGWGSSEEDSRQIFDTFLEAGGNFIDTANIYTNGTSEKLLGEFIKEHRDRVVLATKYSNSPPLNDPNSGGNQRKNMMQAVEKSLKRLQTDYIDLYWLHIWDQITPIEEVMRAFDDLVRQGKVLYIGISDAPAWVVSRANTLAELRGWTSFTGLQIEYSLIERTPERELLPMAQACGLTITAWSPLAGGLLSGKYLNTTSNDARYSNPQMQQFITNKERSDRIAREVKSIADDCGHSPSQVALAWLHQQKVPIIPIIGARTISQLKDNLGCLDLILSPEQLSKLEEVSKIELGFPHDLFTKEMARSFVYGGLVDKIDK